MAWHRRKEELSLSMTQDGRFSRCSTRTLLMCSGHTAITTSFSNLRQCQAADHHLAMRCFHVHTMLAISLLQQLPLPPCSVEPSTSTMRIPGKWKSTAKSQCSSLPVKATKHSSISQPKTQTTSKSEFKNSKTRPSFQLNRKSMV